MTIQAYFKPRPATEASLPVAEKVAEKVVEKVAEEPAVFVKEELDSPIVKEPAASDVVTKMVETKKRLAGISEGAEVDQKSRLVSEDEGEAPVTPKPKKKKRKNAPAETPPQKDTGAEGGEFATPLAAKTAGKKKGAFSKRVQISPPSEKQESAERIKEAATPPPPVITVVSKAETDRIMAKKPEFEAQLDALLTQTMSTVVEILRSSDSFPNEMSRFREAYEEKKTGVDLKEFDALLSSLVQDRNCNLNNLALEVNKTLLPGEETALLDALRDRIPLIAERVSYGVQSRSAITNDDTEKKALWTWEVDAVDVRLPTEARLLLCSLRKDRVKKRSHIRCLAAIVDLLGKERKSDKTWTSIKKEMEKLTKFERELEAMKVREESRKKKEEDRLRKEETRKQKEEEKKRKEIEKKELAERREKEKKEQELLKKEQEQLKKEKREREKEERERELAQKRAEKERLEKEAAEKKDKNQMRIFKFITSEPKVNPAPVVRVDEDRAYGAWHAPPDAIMAPTCPLDDSALETAASNVDKCFRGSEEGFPQSDLLKDFISLGRRSHGDDRRWWKRPLDGDNDVVMADDTPTVARVPMKLLRFHDDFFRPAYYGTFTKPSKALGPRRPFAKDEVLFNYEVDSDDEWEAAEEEGEGESLAGDSDAGSQKMEEEEEEDSEDGWLVPDEMGEEGEAIGNKRPAESEPAASVPKKKKKMTVLVYGTKYADDGENPVLSELLKRHSAQLYGSVMVPISVKEPEPVQEKVSNDDDKAGGSKKPRKGALTDEHVGQLAHYIQGKSGGVIKLAEAFIAAEPERAELSKAAVERAIKSIAEKRKDANGKSRLHVNADVMEAHNVPAIVVEPAPSPPVPEEKKELKEEAPSPIPKSNIMSMFNRQKEAEKEAEKAAKDAKIDEEDDGAGVYTKRDRLRMAKLMEAGTSSDPIPLDTPDAEKATEQSAEGSVKSAPPQSPIVNEWASVEKDLATAVEQNSSEDMTTIVKDEFLPHPNPKRGPMPASIIDLLVKAAVSTSTAVESRCKCLRALTAWLGYLPGAASRGNAGSAATLATFTRHPLTADLLKTFLASDVDGPHPMNRNGIRLILVALETESALALSEEESAVRKAILSEVWVRKLEMLSKVGDGVLIGFVLAVLAKLLEVPDFFVGLSESTQKSVCYLALFHARLSDQHQSVGIPKYALGLCKLIVSQTADNSVFRDEVLAIVFAGIKDQVASPGDDCKARNRLLDIGIETLNHVCLLKDCSLQLQDKSEKQALLMKAVNALGKSELRDLCCPELVNMLS